MLEKFLANVDNIRKASIDMNIEFEFSKNEIVQLENMLNCLKPAMKAIKALSNKNANLITADLVISNVILELETIDSTLSKQLARNIEFYYSSRRLNLETNILCELSGIDMQKNLFYEQESDFVKENFFEQFELPNVENELSNYCIDPIDASFQMSQPRRAKIDRVEMIKAKLLAIRPTSTEVERLFSTCSSVLVAKRSRIASDLLNAIIIINKNNF